MTDETVLSRDSEEQQHSHNASLKGVRTPEYKLVVIESLEHTVRVFAESISDAIDCALHSNCEQIKSVQKSPKVLNIERVYPPSEEG